MVGFDANETVCFCFFLIVYKLFIITSDDDFMYN